MHINRTEGLFAIAEELLLFAEHEQHRAAEDVVGHLICVNSRQSAANYMAGYLLQKGITIHHPVSINSLRDQCIAQDPKFESLDFCELNCRSDVHDRKYCLELDKVNSCLKVAQQVRSIITAETMFDSLI